jgi:[acyl-carrier-protein] S-malonyltransferase
MKHAENRFQYRSFMAGAMLRMARLGTAEDAVGPGLAAEPTSAPGSDLGAKIGSAAFAFRGYDVSNLGRSGELLAHPVYGRIVAEELARASSIASETLRQPIDLAAYVRAAAPTSLEDFPRDVATIVAMQMAQIRILDEEFGVPARDARLSFGYSIGELSAMIMGGSFRLEELLPVPLGLAADCASLAHDTTMGVLFTRAPVLPEADIERLCAVVSGEGRGIVAPSAFLSPNTALLLGQGDTIGRCEALIGDFLPPKATLRRNPNRWPPLHTPLVRQRNIPNRTAVAVYAIPGARTAPRPPVISCVTGRSSIDALSCRETLVQWTERPQRLWDVIDATLSAGVESVIHVGPAPNLIPSTFARLSNNVNKTLESLYFRGPGRGVVSRINRHAWLTALLPRRAVLLRAPFLKHIILEDWLLDRPDAG